MRVRFSLDLMEKEMTRIIANRPLKEVNKESKKAREVCNELRFMRKAWSNGKERGKLEVREHRHGPNARHAEVRRREIQKGREDIQDIKTIDEYQMKEADRKVRKGKESRKKISGNRKERRLIRGEKIGSGRRQSRDKMCKGLVNRREKDVRKEMKRRNNAVDESIEKNDEERRSIDENLNTRKKKKKKEEPYSRRPSKQRNRKEKTEKKERKYTPMHRDVMNIRMKKEKNIYENDRIADERIGEEAARRKNKRKKSKKLELKAQIRSDKLEKMCIEVTARKKKYKMDELKRLTDEYIKRTAEKKLEKKKRKEQKKRKEKKRIEEEKMIVAYKRKKERERKEKKARNDESTTKDEKK
jgi:hypothetical protein